MVARFPIHCESESSKCLFDFLFDSIHPLNIEIVSWTETTTEQLMFGQIGNYFLVTIKVV